MNRAVITLPLSPRKYYELARFTVPIIGDTLASMLGANFYLGINALDSYHNRQKDLEEYLKVYAFFKLDGQIWLDKLHQEELLDLVEKLISKGLIEERKIKSYTCACGIIDMEEKNLATMNPNKRDFIMQDGKIICPHCKTICTLTKKDALVMNYTKIKNPQVTFMPDYLNKDAKTFKNMLNNSYQVISRARNTGISITYQHKNYNIDIDFLWGLYLLLFKEPEKVVICGNHEMYQLYLVGLLEKSLREESKTVLVGTPFLTGLNALPSSISSEEQLLVKKIGILMNIKWFRKEKEYEDSIFKGIAKLPLEKKRELLYNLKEEIKVHQSLEKDLATAMKRFNMQEQLRILKRGK